jgi:hypothetical protein
MEETTDRFSDRKHVIPAGWALVISLVTGFLFLGLGHYLSSGTQEVKVINPVDTVYVANKNESDNAVTPEQLENFLRRLSTGGTAQIEAPSSQTRGIDQASADANSIRIPSYQLPSNVGGYTRRSLNGFANSSCPQSHISQGDVITVSFNLFNSDVVDEATPVFVRLTEITENQNVSRFEQQYSLAQAINVIQIGSNFPRGEYELAFGFYLESELGKQYPPFYARRCSFRIIE